MFCNQCGTAFAHGARFCASCGNGLAVGGTNPPAANSGLNYNTDLSPSQHNSTVRETLSTYRRWRIAAAAGVAALVCVVALTIFQVYRPHKIPVSTAAQRIADITEATDAPQLPAEDAQLVPVVASDQDAQATRLAREALDHAIMVEEAEARQRKVAVASSS